MPTLAHLSDLHLGKSPSNDAAAHRLSLALREAGVDRVLVTGDLTHRGRFEELATFFRLFAPLRERLILVPGNHDRLGDDVGGWLMSDRVRAASAPGLHVVRLDSTAPHNRSLLDGHGEITRGDIAEAERAVATAPARALVVVMLHHHLHELPEDHLHERLSRLLGWPNASELPLGGALLERLAGRCDLVLHGHRHKAGELTVPGGRALQILNAGASPELGRARLLTHLGGRIVAQRWLELPVAGEDRASWAGGGVPAVA